MELTKEELKYLDELACKYGMQEWTLIMMTTNGRRYEAVSNYTDILVIETFRYILRAMLQELGGFITGKEENKGRC